MIYVFFVIRSLSKNIIYGSLTHPPRRVPRTRPNGCPTRVPHGLPQVDLFAGAILTVEECPREGIPQIKQHDRRNFFISVKSSDCPHPIREEIESIQALGYGQDKGKKLSAAIQCWKANGFNHPYFQDLRPSVSLSSGGVCPAIPPLAEGKGVYRGIHPRGLGAPLG